MFTRLVTKLQRKNAARLYRRSARMISKLESHQRVDFNVPPEQDRRVQSINHMVSLCKDAQQYLMVAQLSTCLQAPSTCRTLIQTARRLLNDVDEFFDSLTTPAH